MNFNRVHFIMLFTVLIVIAYIFITKPSKVYQQNANILFHEIINRDIDKLSIVMNRDDDYSYLVITDKIIIKEFMKAIKNDTYLPASPTGQYNYRYAVSLHDKQNSNLLLLRSDTYNDSISNDSVEIIFYDVRNIDVLNLYYNSVVLNKNFFSLFTQLYGFGKYTFRNHQLYNVINKYIKSKGLKYNPYSKKWARD